jgi:hypothetical protein
MVNQELHNAARYLSGKDFWNNVSSARIASEWLKTNGSTFSGSVTEPICIKLTDRELNEKLLQYLNRASDDIDEDSYDIRDMAMFMFSDHDDLIKFEEIISDVMKVRVCVGVQQLATV